MKILCISCSYGNFEHSDLVASRLRCRGRFFNGGRNFRERCGLFDMSPVRTQFGSCLGNASDTLQGSVDATMVLVTLNGYRCILLTMLLAISMTKGLKCRIIHDP